MHAHRWLHAHWECCAGGGTLQRIAALRRCVRGAGYQDCTHALWHRPGPRQTQMRLASALARPDCISFYHAADVHAEGAGVRPFGVALMLAGYDAGGPQLYQIDPSGTFFAWKASAIGKNMMNAKTFLEKRYAEDVEVEDAVHTALLTLKESFEGEMTGSNIEVRCVQCACICPEEATLG